MEDQEQWDERAFTIKHGALRNAIYHTARRRWLDACSRVLTFLVIIAGTSAATDLLGVGAEGVKYIAFSVAVIGALQLVYDYSGRARTHQILQKRYFEQLAEIEGYKRFDEDICKKWEAEQMRIAGDEPPIMRAVDVVSDNQATQYLTGQKNRIEINFWQNISRHIWAHNGGKFPLTKQNS